MGRASKGPRYFPSKGGWYSTQKGERVLLVKGPKGPTEAEAKERYAALTIVRAAETKGDRNPVWAVANAYLADLRNRIQTGDASPGLLEIHAKVITQFVAAHRDVPVRDVRPQHMTAFLARMAEDRWSPKLKRTTRWGDATAQTCERAVNRMFNWAAAEVGMISANPLKRGVQGRKKRRPKRRPSGNRVAITDHEFGLFVDVGKRRSGGDFVPLIRLLKGTGARPSEIYGLRADEWDPAKRAFRIKAGPANHGRYKLAHLGQDRLVFVPAPLVPLVETLIGRRPSGPLLLTEAGTPWSTRIFCSRMQSTKLAANRLAGKRGVEGVRKELTAYSFRHAFVTKWVKENQPLSYLCELLNTSERVVRNHYSHLFEETAALLESLDKFSSGTE